MPSRQETSSTTPPSVDDSNVIVSPCANSLPSVDTGADVQTVLPPSRNLYVSGIDPCVTETELFQIFAEYGPVEQHKLMVNIKTGVSRGFGFIMYRELQHAIEAVRGLDGFILYGKPLGVRFADQNTRTPAEPTRRLVIRNIPAGQYHRVAPLCASCGTVTMFHLYYDDRRSERKSNGTSNGKNGHMAHTTVSEVHSASLVALVEMSTVQEALAVVHHLNNSMSLVQTDSSSSSDDSAGARTRRPLQVKLVEPNEVDIISRLGPSFAPIQRTMLTSNSAATPSATLPMLPGTTLSQAMLSDSPSAPHPLAPVFMHPGLASSSLCIWPSTITAPQHQIDPHHHAELILQNDRPDYLAPMADTWTTPPLHYYPPITGSGESHAA